MVSSSFLLIGGKKVFNGIVEYIYKLKNGRVYEWKERKQMGKWSKVLLSVFGVLAVVAIVALVVVNTYIGKSKPFIEGEIIAEFLEKNVTVERDSFGVPHITAESDADLYRAQGYVQAQDRLFQMDMARRQASGRLSEVVGEAAIGTDKKFRTFSLRAAAEASYDGYGEEAKKVLGWYAEGVNAFIEEAERDGKLPYEFKILGYQPEPWTAD